ncbi:MAG: hypothetical protein LBQ71_20615 [Hungatella sp.]|nr:hypothetical protein [Hungatella sp.]
MEKETFLMLYWAQYINLEKEFRNTLHYISLDPKNYDTFSPSFLKLILSIGSEIDIVSKVLAARIDAEFNGENITSYCKSITKHLPHFSKVMVKTLNEKIKLEPWRSWDNNNSPDWWKYYNKIKHNRTGISREGVSYYHYANLKNVLLSLSGLYQLLMYLYYNIAINTKDYVKTPLPGSRLFTLEGDFWNEVTIYNGDFAFELNMDDGCLYLHNGEIPY